MELESVLRNISTKQASPKEPVHSAEASTLETGLRLLLNRYPEYRKTLAMALSHEDSSSGGFKSYQGWQWHDVRTHPTKLIRLVTEGLIRIKCRARQSTYYLLEEKETVRKVLNEDSKSLDGREHLSGP